MFISHNNNTLFNLNQAMLHRYLINNQHMLNFLVNILKNSHKHFNIFFNFKIVKIVWSNLNYNFYTAITVFETVILRPRNCVIYKINFTSAFTQLNYKLKGFLLNFNRSNLNNVNKFLNTSIQFILIYNAFYNFISKTLIYFNFFYVQTHYFKLEIFNFTQKSNFFKLQLGYNLRINNVTHLTRYNWALI